MTQPPLILEDESQQRWELTQPRVTLGKGPGNDVMIVGDAQVSRDHAIIEWTGTAYQLTLGDRRPRFPPLVNGQPVTHDSGPRALAQGDVIQIGRRQLRVG